MATTTGRRTLQFASLDEVMPDVDQLAHGYTAVGRWNLAQICNHLAGAVNGSIDGFPIKAPWLVRKLVAPFALKHLVKTGSMPEGVRVPEQYVPAPSLDQHAEVESLRAALRRFADHHGPVAPHPFFGTLNRAQWDQIHRIHCAHHLSFAQSDASVQV